MPFCWLQFLQSALSLSPLPSPSSFCLLSLLKNFTIVAKILFLTRPLLGGSLLCSSLKQQCLLDPLGSDMAGDFLGVGQKREVLERQNICQSCGCKVRGDSEEERDNRFKPGGACYIRTHIDPVKTEAFTVGWKVMVSSLFGVLMGQ